MTPDAASSARCSHLQLHFGGWGCHLLCAPQSSPGITGTGCSWPSVYNETSITRPPVTRRPTFYNGLLQCRQMLQCKSPPSPLHTTAQLKLEIPTAVKRRTALLSFPTLAPGPKAPLPAYTLVFLPTHPMVLFFCLHCFLCCTAHSIPA